MKRLVIFFFLATLCHASHCQKNRSSIMMRKENFIDGREQLNLYAMLLEKYKTPVMWQTIVDTRECDELMLLPDGALLYGLLDVRSDTDSKFSFTKDYLTMYANYGLLCKVDANTGKILWKYERTGKFSDVSYAILTVTENTIIVRHQSAKMCRIIGISNDNGKEIWKHELKTGSQCLLMYDMSTLFTYLPSDNGLSIEGLSLGENKKLYSSVINGVGKDCAAYLIGVNKIIITDKNKYFVIDAAKGTLQHQKETALSISGLYPFDNDAYMLVCSDGTATMIGNDGSEIWKFPSSGYIPFLCSEYNGLLYWIKNVNAQTSLVAANAKNGKIEWEQPLDSYLKSNFCFENGKIALTTAKKLWFFDAVTGAVEKETAFNTGGKSEIDRISISGNNWIVVTENSVSCYNPSFARLWEYDLKDFVMALSNYTPETPKTPAGSYEIVQAGYKTSEILTAQRMQEHRKFVNKMGPGSVSREYIAGAASMEKTLAAANLQFAAMQTGMAIAQAKGAMYLQAGMMRTEASYEMAFRENQINLQGQFYIRRFETGKSVNLLVVDFETGKWAELILGLKEGKDIEEGALLKTCIYAYNPMEETISSYGIGLDRTKWETIEIHRTTTVKSSLLSFRIADMNFRDYSEYAANTIAK